MIQLVVPNTSAGGVYDFTRILANRIDWDAVSIIQLDKENVGAWVTSAEDTVIIQMSGYGYSPRGIPLWLISALNNKRKSIHRLGIYFHELFATGPPWTSAFWLSPVQKWIAREMVETADFWLTNTPFSKRWLSQHASTPNKMLPVFSNIGELDHVDHTRDRSVVVFGGKESRARVYRDMGIEIFNFANDNDLIIHDIGSGSFSKETLGLLTDNNALIHGELPAREISTLISHATFGAISYPIDLISKSGIWAAYASHGVCPILYSSRDEGTSALASDKHFLTPYLSAAESLDKAGRIGKTLWTWYQGHNIDSQLKVLKAMCERQTSF